uniref:Tubulin polyglutamylase TTLL11 n=1 Tax=Oryctolagus cuniculus TaxID=9986 RepID=A0A5F9DQX7_RABIT
MAATASVTGLVTWTRSPMRWLGLGRRLSLPGPRPEAEPALVNRRLSDHGNGLGQGARGGGGGGSSLVSSRGGRAAAAAAAALAPALSAMRRGSAERELAERWELEAKAKAAAERVGVDAGAAGEPERKAAEEQPKAPAPEQPRAAEEGDAGVSPQPPPALPQDKPRPALARGPCQHGKPRSKGRSCKRSSGRLPDECGALRPVTVDSSKAKTSLDALKISIRQLKWKEVQMVKEGDPSWKPTFIVKPDGGCQGDGIYLIKDPTDARLAGTLQSRPAVVQEYMCKPLLIDKLKFDIRLYVLLKSLDPLEIYIAKDGLSRFCTEPYQEPSAQNLHHVFMHLTNYSLNIHSGNFIHSDSASTGSKRTFSSILCRLSSKGVDIKKVWSDIISLVIKTVIALTPELKVFYQSDIPTGRPGPTCFQILGFDILLMKNLKPVLLEVNANPSMRIEHEQELSPGVFENVPSVVDEEVKVAVIRDTLRLMDPLRKKRDNQNCKLSGSSLSMAAVDILYIDITRRWNSMALDQRDSGMCLQAFVEAFFFLAQRKSSCCPSTSRWASLIDLCEYHPSMLDEKAPWPSSRGRPAPPGAALLGQVSPQLAGGNPPTPPPAGPTGSAIPDTLCPEGPTPAPRRREGALQDSLPAEGRRNSRVRRPRAPRAAPCWPPATHPWTHDL